MKLFLTSILTLSFLFSLQAEEKKVVIPDNLKAEYWKLRAKGSQITDQFKQLQLAQQELAQKFTALKPENDKQQVALKAFCESQKQDFLETPDDISCVEKKVEKKEKEDKK